MAGNFLRARNGNVAVMFGLLLVPILLAAGVSIDLMRAGEARARLSQAADAGLLAAARAKNADSTLSDDDAELIARKYFDANGAASGVIISTFDFVVDSAAKTYRLDIDGTLDTTLLGIAGQKTLPIDILAEAKVAPARALEVILVLDNTDSMNATSSSGQTKLDDLEDAAVDLINTIMADPAGNVRVGVVPFSTHVNIGMSREFEPWFDAPADSSYARTTCSVDSAAATGAGCSETAATCYNDGVPYSCTQWTCPGGAAPPKTCTTTTQPTEWQGCAGSRDHPWNIKDEQYGVHLVPGVLNHAGAGGDCPGEILPLTADKSQVLAAITAMTTNSNTYIPAGLKWGLMLISSEYPFSEGMTPAQLASDGGAKVMVLMTDGENTVSPNADGSHYDNDVDLADDYTDEVCTEIKDAGVLLYTIAFDISDSDTQAMVRDCATSTSSFFNASNAADLTAAFGRIGASLQELALTK